MTRDELRETIARAIYERDPAQGQETDADYRPVSDIYTVAWEKLADFDEGWHQHCLDSADAVLSAIAGAGMAVAPRELAPTERLRMVLATGRRQTDGGLAIDDTVQHYALMVASADLAREPEPESAGR